MPRLLALIVFAGLLCQTVPAVAQPATQGQDADLGEALLALHTPGLAVAFITTAFKRS